MPEVHKNGCEGLNNTASTSNNCLATSAATLIFFYLEQRKGNVLVEQHKDPAPYFGADIEQELIDIGGRVGGMSLEDIVIQRNKADEEAWKYRQPKRTNEDNPIISPNAQEEANNTPVGVDGTPASVRLAIVSTQGNANDDDNASLHSSDSDEMNE